MPDIPAFIGRYRIEEVINKGAFGIVYKAVDDLIGRTVALKCLLVGDWGDREERERRMNDFTNEAKVTGSLKHDHITAIYDMGIQNDQPYIVMEYVEGSTLKQILNNKMNFHKRDILKLVAMIARPLHFIHNRGFLHRDIKPGNIMIEPHLSPKIMDFGVAVMRSPSLTGSPSFSVKGDRIAGTPAYMSPEQIRGDDMDERSDLFSLGILAYEWLAGKNPFIANTMAQTTKNILEKEPEPLSSLADVDEELQAIINKTLAKAPNDRYRTIDAFSDELEVYCSKHYVSTQSTPIEPSSRQIRTIGLLRRKYVFFADFEESELLDIFRISQRETYKTNDVIIWQGTSGVEMYFILKGSVVVRENMNGNDIDIQTLGEGECFGEMAIVDRHPRSASVVARDDTTVVAINEAVLRKSKPELCLKLYRNLAAVISEKLRDTDRRHLDLVASLSKLLLHVQADASGIHDISTIDLKRETQDQ